jgi:hypothetical protein
MKVKTLFPFAHNGGMVEPGAVIDIADDCPDLQFWLDEGLIEKVEESKQENPIDESDTGLSIVVEDVKPVKKKKRYR